MSQPSLLFSHILLPLSVLDQALSRIHEGGWSIMGISSNPMISDGRVLVVTACPSPKDGLGREPLEELVWKKEREEKG